MKQIDFKNTSLYDTLLNSVNNYPNNIAIYFDKKDITYSKFLELVNNTAKLLLDNGVKEGDVITLISHNSINFIVMFYAVSKIGAISSIIHYGTSVSEIEDLLKITESKIIYTDRNELIDNTNIFNKVNLFITNQLEIIKANDISQKPLNKKCSVILYTSGSTGFPKAVMFDSYQFNVFAYQSKCAYPDINSNSKVLVPIPMFHGFGLATGVHNTITLGGTVILLSKEDKKDIDVIFKKQEINCIIGVPSFFEKLLNNPKLKGIDLSKLQRVIIGGSPAYNDFDSRVNSFLKENGANISIQVGYGLTECLSGVTLNSQGETIGVGKPFKYNELKIIKNDNKAGEILIKSPVLMTGYLNHNSSVDEDGWLHTGDIGYMENGYLFFVTRKSRSIHTSGYLINLDNLESTISKCFKVENVAVVAKKDTIKGAVPVAFITGNISLYEIEKYCKDHISVYALPIIYLIDKIPLTETGKTDYKRLERLLFDENSSINTNAKRS